MCGDVISLCGSFIVVIEQIVDVRCCLVFFFQAEDGIRDLVRSRGLGDVYKRQKQDNQRYNKKERGQ